MTIDERLDRLTERHEALTQTVELIAIGQIKNDEAMAHLAGPWTISRGPWNTSRNAWPNSLRR